MMDMLVVAIAKGSHPSAMEPEAAMQLRAETLEKVVQGYARLVTWAELKDDMPKNLKLVEHVRFDSRSRDSSREIGRTWAAPRWMLRLIVRSPFR